MVYFFQSRVHLFMNERLWFGDLRFFLSLARGKQFCSYIETLSTTENDGPTFRYAINILSLQLLNTVIFLSGCESGSKITMKTGWFSGEMNSIFQVYRNRVILWIQVLLVMFSRWKPAWWMRGVRVHRRKWRTVETWHYNCWSETISCSFLSQTQIKQFQH